MFACQDVGLCAVRIAQESAHLLGLDHTNDRSDVMYPRDTDGHARFRDVAQPTLNPRCAQPRQNSHALLVSRLGKSRATTTRSNRKDRP